MADYDFLVIGTGSGLDVANIAVNNGRSVAVVEKGPIGGTCLNRGCIPSKKLIYHADIVETINRSEEFHIDAEINEVDFSAIVQDTNHDVSSDSESIRNGLQSSAEFDLFEGEGQFVDNRTVEIVSGRDERSRIQATTILIAAGTRPHIPDIQGINSVDYLTSTEALQLEKVPDHLVIVGGGYIAAELAHFFGTFGSDITIIGRRPYLLPEADEEVGYALTERYRDRFSIHTGYEVRRVSENTDSITVKAEPFVRNDPSVPADEPISVNGDKLLIAAGRIPNTDTLNLDATDVETDPGGFIKTDEYLRTTAENIWSLGDIVGEYLLKHNANHEARTVARNIFVQDPEPID